MLLCFVFCCVLKVVWFLDYDCIFFFSFFFLNRRGNGRTSEWECAFDLQRGIETEKEFTTSFAAINWQKTRKITLFGCFLWNYWAFICFLVFFFFFCVMRFLWSFFNKKKIKQKNRKKSGFFPAYVRQTTNELTGEHTCIMLKGENTKKKKNFSFSFFFLQNFWLYYFLLKTLLSRIEMWWSRNHLQSQMAFPILLWLQTPFHFIVVECLCEYAGFIGFVCAANNSNSKCGGNVEAENRFDTFAIWYEAIGKLLPKFGWLSHDLRFGSRNFQKIFFARFGSCFFFFFGKGIYIPCLYIYSFVPLFDFVQLNARTEIQIQLSAGQCAILIAMGLQNRNVDQTGAEMNLPVNQVMLLDWIFFSSISSIY